MSTIRAAFYEKNLPTWERVLRVAVSLAAAAWAFVALSSPLSWVVIGSVAGFAATGFVGFCPACAMVGRKLKK